MRYEEYFDEETGTLYEIDIETGEIIDQLSMTADEYFSYMPEELEEAHDRFEQAVDRLKPRVQEQIREIADNARANVGDNAFYAFLSENWEDIGGALIEIEMYDYLTTAAVTFFTDLFNRAGALSLDVQEKIRTATEALEQESENWEI